MRQAPTFVLTLNDATGNDVEGSCGSGCVTPAGYASVAGDVSLDYALDHFQRSAPAFAKDAGRFLARLRGRE